MGVDLAAVSSGQDGVEVGEVLLEGGPADPGCLSNLSHHDGAHPALEHQSQVAFRTASRTAPRRASTVSLHVFDTSALYETTDPVHTVYIRGNANSLDGSPDIDQTFLRLWNELVTEA